MTAFDDNKPTSDMVIAGFFVGSIAILTLFGWFAFPSLERIDNLQRARLVLPGILRAMELPSAQAQTVLTEPVHMGRSITSAMDLGIIQAAPDGDHSKVFWSRLSAGVCIGLQVYAHRAPNDFNDLVLTVPGHIWRNAKDIQDTNCRSLPDHFTLTFERRRK